MTSAWDRISRLLHSAALAGSAAAFLAAAWRFLSSPLDHVLRIVSDDAFYYLQIARNLTRLGRSTADGLANTNGYHPLWMACCAVVALLVPDNETFLRTVLGLSLALQAVGAIVLFQALRRVVGSRWALTAGACWLASPLTFRIATQGVESSVYAIALLVAFAVHLRMAERDDLPPLRLSAAYGASLGAVVVARTEGIIVAAVAFGWMSYRARRSRAGLRAEARPLAATSAAFLAVLLPWLLFSWWQVGTIVQDSGAMKALWMTDEGFAGFSGRLRNAIFTFEYFVRGTLRWMTATIGYNVVWFLVCAAFAAAVSAVILTRPRSPQSRALGATLAPAAAIWLTYCLALGERQLWWMTFPGLVCILTTIVCLQALLESAPSGVRSLQPWIQIALIVAATIVFVRWDRRGEVMYPWHPDVRRSQAMVEAMVPPPARIGCFNAGIPLFFGSGRVAALDGLVNHRARLFWQAHRVDDYLREQHIEYVADERFAIGRALRFSREQPALQIQARFPLTNWPSGDRFLWKIVRYN